MVESSQTVIRVVGLSATLPNYTDVAEFLSVNPFVGKLLLFVPENTHILSKGLSSTVWPTSCFTSLDAAKQLNLLISFTEKSSQI